MINDGKRVDTYANSRKDIFISDRNVSKDDIKALHAELNKLENTIKVNRAECKSEIKKAYTVLGTICIVELVAILFLILNTIV